MIRTTARAAALLLAAVLSATLLAAPAHARPTPEVAPALSRTVAAQAAAAAVRVAPRSGEGAISLVSRTCGTSRNWFAKVGASYLYADRTYLVDCAATAPAVRPASSTASRSSAARASGWVHPLASGVTARNAGACPGAARSGHTHRGIDLSASSGTPIRSIGGGRVTVSRYSSSAGWYVVVNHGQYTSTYMHLRVQGARVGTNVGAGQQIGQVGATGNARGPHLHFEATGAGNTAQTARALGLRLGC